jgi:hypothetical protein
MKQSTEKEKETHKLLPTQCLFVGCFASIRNISNKRKQTQIRGDDQRKQRQRWITDSETKRVKKKKLQKAQKKNANKNPS